MSFKMNELKARMKNRVESNYLFWKLTQIEREKTCHLVQCNKQLSEVKSDLKSIKTSTGTIRKQSVSAESRLDQTSSSKSRTSSAKDDNDDDDSYSRRGTLIDYTFIKDEDGSNRVVYTNDTIEDLKKKDPVLIKRLKQMEIFKRSGRAPYFDEHRDELKPPKVIFSKASLIRQKSELCEETRRSAMMVPHENYDYVYQARLKPQIDLFIQSVNMVK